MTALERVLNAAKGRCDPANDSELARRLGVSRSLVSLWRRGEPISEKQLAAVVDLAMMDAGMAVEVLKEQAQTDAQRVIWGALSGRLMHIMSGVRLSARKVAARLGANH
jgi:transcriptional regulator with XRE-family HTH domain